MEVERIISMTNVDRILIILVITIGVMLNIIDHFEINDMERRIMLLECRNGR